MTGRTRPLDHVPGLRELAGAQLGVVRREQLRDLGITHEHVRSQVSAQRWTPLGPRVVVLSTGVLTRAQRRAVAVAHAGPCSALAGHTALESLGLRGWDRDAVHVVVPHGRLPPRLAGIVVHQTRHLTPVDLVRGSWPPCTTAARAAIDAASWERHERAASGLVIASVQQRLTTPDALFDVIDRLEKVRHRELLRAMTLEAARGADARSEVDVTRVLRSVGLPEPRRQCVIETPDGPRRVDLTVDLPDGRTLVVEIDGIHHADSRVREADAVKDAALVAAGYVVLRIPVSLLRRDPALVRAQLRAIAARSS